ncbi:Uncharacterized membrane protein [Mucilaginibacter gossypiicola]|uniref:Uncharacterized membrane protein n=1 Tax=Mucilaginibacter gossypiicola TaxID=551995 RepID=A0A1H8B8N1_9SPHI|nr:vitamin K epoxide reductase family protein [Mucilaginibacter gossypiicola]SEM79311.1 Uncharacterized membrane protein [Mucilaginibacter gossypiicola]
MQHFLTRLLEPKTNGPQIAILLTSILKVKISASTLTREIEQHPDYPSLLSISDVLNNFGVENIGIRLEKSKVAEVPVPFITQIKGLRSSEKLFTVVNAIDNIHIHFFDPETHKWSKLLKEDFIKRTSGVAMMVEVGDNAGESDYQTIIRKEYRKVVIQMLNIFCIPVLLLLSVVVSLFKYGGYMLLPAVFTGFTLVGAIAGVLLLWYEFDQYNPILQQICSAGKKINCSAILQSTASKIAGISWSSIGFSYFVGTLLLLLFGGLNTPAILFITAWMAMGASPYVIFSVYYQWRIAKQWCILCLVVQGVLISQLSIVLAGNWQNLSDLSALESGFIISCLTAFLIPLLVTNSVLPAMKKAKESNYHYTELQKLKHNAQIFGALLQKQKVLSETPTGLGISLGNVNGTYKLIKVCNPYCGPCAKAHLPVEELLQGNPEVHIQILFTATSEEWDFKAPPVRHLLAIAEKNDEQVVKNALGDWYLAEKRDYETFAAKYPMNGELKRQDEKVDAMTNWCLKTGIDFTPTFFVSVRSEDSEKDQYFQLPDIYSVKDLKYFFSV